MRYLFILFLISLSLNINAQDDKTVTLVVSGQGATQDEARQKALRSAIEQAFGAFISSKMEILNDILVKDEIVSVANGNIQKFDVISEVQIPNGEYTISVKATVSVTKLTSFVESKVGAAEFKGNLFAATVLLQDLYEKNELEAIKNLSIIIKDLSKKAFDYKIEISDPLSNNVSWNIPVTVNVIANSNFLLIANLFSNYIKSLSLSSLEVQNYNNLKKVVYPITLATLDTLGIFYLRNPKSYNYLIDLIYSFNNSISDFQIINDIDKFKLSKYNTSILIEDEEYNNLNVLDDNFRIVLKNWSDGSDFCSVQAASLFHNQKYNEEKRPRFDYRNIWMDQPHFNIRNSLIKSPDCNFLSKPNAKSFIPLKNIMLANENLGLVLSFATINVNDTIIQFKFKDVRSVDEVKKITGYKIAPN